MPRNFFLITGMFRSGTTLVSKIMNAHPEIACMPDVYTPVFNNYRDAVCRREGIFYQPNEPIQDYFADPRRRRFLGRVLELDFDVPYDHGQDENLLARIRSRGRLTCPAIVSDLNAVTGETYAEVYSGLLDRIMKHYGGPSSRLCGNKEVWVTEFIPALARSFPEAKFIVVDRDPRGVCASKNLGSVKSCRSIRNEQYPWLFLLRQWRKLAILAWLCREVLDVAKRVYYLCFEDLLRDPKRHIEEMSAFLGLEPHPDMLDPNSFVDGFNKRWLQNSSYDCVGKKDGYLVFKEKEGRFDTSRIDKWRDVMSPYLLEYVEQICFPEMLLSGYSPLGSDRLGLTDKMLFEPPRVMAANMQEWIQEIYKNYGDMDMLDDMCREQCRQNMLTIESSLAGKLSREIRESYFLDVRYFDKARELVSRRAAGA